VEPVVSGPDGTPARGGPADEELLDALAGMWERHDPPPADLADRMVLAVQVERLHADLLELESSWVEPVGARGVSPAHTLTFSNDEVSLLVTVAVGADGRRRLDGWVAPAAGGTVEARRADTSPRRAEVDENGRFVIDGLPGGLVQLLYRPADGERGAVVSPPVRL
jgi:hypothetical protein